MIKILVSTHSGDSDELTVEEFDPAEINEQLNSNEVQSILIGDHIYSRIDVKNIKPIAENSTHTIRTTTSSGGGISDINY